MNFESIITGCLNEEDTPWIPFTPFTDKVHLKYFKIDPVHGEMIVLLKSPPGMPLARHHHTGTVIVYTIQGAWKYKEHDWIARAGSLVYETASSQHTPVAVSDKEEVIVLNIIKGELLYFDDNNKLVAIENWKTSMDRYLSYCKANEWGERPHVLVVRSVASGTEPSAEDVRAAVARVVAQGKLSRYATPERVTFVDALEKTSVGKLDKRALRSRYG